MLIHDRSLRSISSVIFGEGLHMKKELFATVDQNKKITIH